MAPTHGSSAEQKNAGQHDKCVELGSGLTALFETVLSPAKVTLDNASDISEAWAYLTFSKRTVCNPSTFCLWPTIAANKGYLADTPLFFSGARPKFVGVHHLSNKAFISPAQFIQRNYTIAQILSWIAEH